MSTLEQRLAATLAEHDWSTPRGYAWLCCTCGVEFPGEDDALAHVADHLAATVREWLGEEQVREAVREELLNVGHEPSRPSYAEVAFMDATHAALAALTAVQQITHDERSEG